MALTTPYPTAADDSPMTATIWNNSNCYQLLHAESYDYDDDSSSNILEYSYTADTAATGVMVLATGYMELMNDDDGTITIQVDGVTKATQNITSNVGLSGGNIWLGFNTPIWCVLTNSDMTVAADHTIKVELSNGEAGTMRITGLLIYAY